MKDPNRLLSRTGTLEAQLLDAVRNAEPPAEARDEVWRRMGIAAGAGAATLAATTPIAARTAAGAGAKAISQTGWLSVVKWMAVVGTMAPAAGVGVHWMLASRAPSPAAAVPPAAPRESLPTVTRPVAPVQDRPKPVVPSLPPALTSVAGPSRHAAAPASSLDAESALLRRAREKLESGDAKAALDDVAVLSARFPRGELAQEREVVAIQALLAQGQRAAASARIADFLRLHPGSPYADSLRQTVTAGQ